MLHLDIHKQDVKATVIIINQVHPIRKDACGNVSKTLLAIPLDIGKQGSLIFFFILYDCDSYHIKSPKII